MFISQSQCGTEDTLCKSHHLLAKYEPINPTGQWYQTYDSDSVSDVLFNISMYIVLNNTTE